MRVFCIASVSVMILGGLALPAAAAKKPGLAPYAGSYSGQAVSSAGATTLANSSTMTFTGKKYTLRGTFLYTGILNAGGVEQKVVQTFNVSSKGVITGRVTVGDRNGTGAGSVRLTKRTLHFSIVYTLEGLEGIAPATIQLAGRVVFNGRRATMTAQISSSEAAFNGTLTVTGRR